ncbi:hypothetical protein [Nocardiopsis sp. ATB16-24]|uniref:hypothetical protein n=1 Tax=Nocardiopsis sp. ATB16-24 TaxID=3019555 RepID=UPI0025558B64|nr:hypothetical protein [Nocardiopsis sp. ATB16-24]
MTPSRSAAAVALILLVSTGCAAGQRTSAPTDLPGPSPWAPGSRVAAGEGGPKEAYVAALARTGEPERMREGLALTAEGSDAHAYLTHQAAVAQAWADEGDPAPNTEVNDTADGHELCPAGEPGTEPSCVSYSDLTVEDGLVTGLLVDGRDPGPSLLVAEGKGDESEGVRADLVTAYQSVVDKTLVVTVEFSARERASLDLLQASYERRGGRERRTQSAAGRLELDAGATTHAAFFFPAAVPGGTLRVNGCLEECSALVELALPVEK